MVVVVVGGALSEDKLPGCISLFHVAPSITQSVRLHGSTFT